MCQFLFRSAAIVALTLLTAAPALADKGRTKGTQKPSNSLNLSRKAMIQPSQSLGSSMRLQMSSGQNPTRLNSNSLARSNLTVPSTRRNVQSTLATQKLGSAKLNSAALTKVAPKTVLKGIHSSIPFAPHHIHAPLTSKLWCHYQPTHCHWWWNHCHAMHHLIPTHYCYWNWYYVNCPQIVQGVVISTNQNWYLGIQGMLLPDTGLGISAVAAGSPAERAGLKPGMIIRAVNGLNMVDEASMGRAISQSGGVLQMLVQADANSEAIPLTVAMDLVRNVSW